MKPRIQLAHGPRENADWSVWSCKTDAEFVHEFGTTPKSAYDAWVKARERTPVPLYFIQEPPKPSTWLTRLAFWFAR